MSRLDFKGPDGMVERNRRPAHGHNTRRMLQALDAYWLHCDGMPKNRYPRGKYDMEEWWFKFEKYRRLVEEEIHD